MKGYKGSIYNSGILNHELKDIKYAILFSNNKKIKCKIIDFINLIDKNIFLKKFANLEDFYNELNGYKKLIKIFGNKINKYTTIKQGFIYKGNNIYGIFFDDNYYLFLEKCDNTIDKIKFTQKTFNKFSRRIMKILRILKINNFLHNDIKPSNIIECDGNYKIIDWDLSYNLNKQVKGFYFTKNGNFLYNHPIKFYYTGIPLIVNKLIFGIKLLFDKDIRKLKPPLIIREIIDDSFNYLNKNKMFYFKYSDYFAFVLVYIFIAEKNNLKISLKLINPILKLFNIKMI